MEKAGATPQGMGNQCSVEFNLAYRWHSAISAGDEAYTEKIYEELMGKPADQVSIPELLVGLGKYEQGLDKDSLSVPSATWSGSQTELSMTRTLSTSCPTPVKMWPVSYSPEKPTKGNQKTDDLQVLSVPVTCPRP